MPENVYTKEFEEYLESFDILYVEDEDKIRELLEKRLSKHFGKVYTAQNGEVGLYKFETHRPKVVVTDIRMPIMDGLEMLKIIKEKAPRTKVVITTAHNDMDFIMRSIEIGIDRYLLKPIETNTLVSALKKICFGIYTEEKAIECQRKSIGEKSSRIITNIFEQLSYSIPNPMILYSGKKPIFVNKAFSDLFSIETMCAINGAELDIESFLGIKNKEKVSISLPSGRKKVFDCYKTEIKLDGEDKTTLYSFNDMTAFEYQNSKLKSYADILYDILKMREKTSEDSFSRQTGADTNKDGSVRVQSMLSSSEMEALKRSHIYKISAKEYVEDITEDVLAELDELRELELEIDEILDRMDEDGNFALRIGELGGRFVSYSHSIGKLIEFEDLAVAVRNLGNFILTLDTVQNVKWSRFVTHIQNIKIDLTSWRETIFVEKNTLDIHYLDSSLMSSCIQIQLDVTDQKGIVDDENDLELF